MDVVDLVERLDGRNDWKTRGAAINFISHFAEICESHYTNWTHEPSDAVSVNIRRKMPLAEIKDALSDHNHVIVLSTLKLLHEIAAIGMKEILADAHDTYLSIQRLNSKLSSAESQTNSGSREPIGWRCGPITGLGRHFGRQDRELRQLEFAHVRYITMSRSCAISHEYAFTDLDVPKEKLQDLVIKGENDIVVEALRVLRKTNGKRECSLPGHGVAATISHYHQTGILLLLSES
jgi:hypothetical protein